MWRAHAKTKAGLLLSRGRAIWRDPISNAGYPSEHYSDTGEKSIALHSHAALQELPNFEVKDVHDHIGSTIQQNDVSSNQHMRAIGGWRREPLLEVFWAGLKAFLESRRECAAPYELLFQPRRQLILFS